MRAAIEKVELRGLHDKAQHCIAAGLIAQYCSTTEARLASVGKEIQDVFGPGHAQLSDIAASNAGIRCAKAAARDSDLTDCCRSLYSVGG